MPKRRGRQPDALRVSIFLLKHHDDHRINKNMCSEKAIERLRKEGYGPPADEFLGSPKEKGRVHFSFEMTNVEFKNKLVEIYPKLDDKTYLLMRADKSNALQKLTIASCSYNPKEIYNSNLGQGKLYIRFATEEQIQHEVIPQIPAIIVTPSAPKRRLIMSSYRKILPKPSANLASPMNVSVKAFSVPLQQVNVPQIISVAENQKVLLERTSNTVIPDIPNANNDSVMDNLPQTTLPAENQNSLLEHTSNTVSADTWIANNDSFMDNLPQTTAPAENHNSLLEHTSNTVSPDTWIANNDSFMDNLPQTTARAENQNSLFEHTSNIVIPDIPIANNDSVTNNVIQCLSQDEKLKVLSNVSERLLGVGLLDLIANRTSILASIGVTDAPTSLGLRNNIETSFRSTPSYPQLFDTEATLQRNLPGSTLHQYDTIGTANQVRNLASLQANVPERSGPNSSAGNTNISRLLSYIPPTTMVPDSDQQPANPQGLTGTNGIELLLRASETSQV